MDVLQIFHKSQLDKVKKQCKASFVSHISEKGNNYLRVKVPADKDSEFTHNDYNILINKNVNIMSSEDYDTIIQQINNNEDSVR